MSQCTSCKLDSIDESLLPDKKRHRCSFDSDGRLGHRYANWHCKVHDRYFCTVDVPI